MYAGHAGVALAIKTRQPQVAIGPLTLACYGPDWIESVIRLLALPVDPVVYTHSIPAVLVGALLSGALYRMLFGRAGAWAVVAGWLLHWPADFFTGIKPLLDERHTVGLLLYNTPWADLALESLVLLAAGALYWRAYGTSPARRRTILVMTLALVATQGTLDHFFAMRTGWGLPLAEQGWRPHLTFAVR